MQQTKDPKVYTMVFTVPIALFTSFFHVVERDDLSCELLSIEPEDQLRLRLYYISIDRINLSDLMVTVDEYNYCIQHGLDPNDEDNNLCIHEFAVPSELYKDLSTVLKANKLDWKAAGKKDGKRIINVIYRSDEDTDEILFQVAECFEELIEDLRNHDPYENEPEDGDE